MSDYASDAADVLDALQEDGMAMTVRRTSAGIYDPATGKVTGGIDTDYPTYGLIKTPTMYRSGGSGDFFFNGTLVQTGDKFIFLGTLAITPVPGDLLIFGSEILTINTLIAIEPGGVPLAYVILARK